MATNPNPDRDYKFMQETHGTSCLITDYKADKFLNQASKRRKLLKVADAIKDSWTI